MKPSTSSIAGMECRPKYLVEESRSLGEDEDANDRNDALSDVVSLARFPSDQIGVDTFQGGNQPEVEVGNSG